MREVLIIWAKELRDTIRDRRTLLVMVVVPTFLTPAMIVGLKGLARSTTTSTVRVVVAGGDTVPRVVRLLRAQPDVTVSSGPNPVAAVRSGRADAGLVIARDFAVRVQSGRVGGVTLIGNTTQLNSSRALDAIGASLTAYRDEVVAARLRAHGLSAALLAPIRSGTRDVATRQESSNFVLSLIVPMFFVIYSLLGGMYTAMDLSAGEKERFTLEALLLSPATKQQITFGKLLAVCTVAVCTIVLALGSLFIALQSTGPIGGRSSGAVNLPAGSIALVVVLGVLLALSFSSLELALGIFARSFKEAQSYITPLYLLAVLPTVALGSIPGLRAPTAFYLIPALNVVLLLKETLVGVPDLLHVALTVATMLLFCTVAVAFTLRMFGDERVLLRS